MSDPVDFPAGLRKEVNALIDTFLRSAESDLAEKLKKLAFSVPGMPQDQSIDVGVVLSASYDIKVPMEIRGEYRHA